MSSGPATLHFNSNGGTYPPHGTITPNDHGAYVVVTTWIFMCLMVLSLLARLASRWNVSIDKIVIMIAAILSIAQSVAVHIAVNYGLGRHIQNISYVHFLNYSKATYTSQLLSLITLVLVKISLLIVFSYFTRSKKFLSFLYIFATSLVLWGVAGLLALAFQCERPKVWSFEGAGVTRCMNQDIIYHTNAILNILTDALLIILPVLILWNVQIPRERKWGICSVFGLRILVIISSMLQLCALETYLGSVDRSWTDVPLTLWTQISLFLSLITACIPLMAPFLEKLQFGLIDSSVPVRSNSGLRMWGVSERGDSV